MVDFIITLVHSVILIITVLVNLRIIEKVKKVNELNNREALLFAILLSFIEGVIIGTFIGVLRWVF